MRSLLLLLFIVLVAPRAHASEPLTIFNVVLLQQGAILEERVPNVDAMAEYIKAVQAALREAAVASEAKQSVGGFIAVAVRPGLQSNVWLDFDTMLDLEIRKQIILKVRAVKPFEVVKGPVAFALKVALWNGRESKRAAPSPPEWRSAAPGGVKLEFDELIDRSWSE